jgi:hypothetical protein
MYFNLKLAIISAILMFIFELVILLNLYKRSDKLRIISLIVAPLFIIIAQLITSIIYSDPKRTISYPVLFIILALIELPLSIYGYELTPNASLFERVIIAASVGTVITLISEYLLQFV